MDVPVSCESRSTLNREGVKCVVLRVHKDSLDLHRCVVYVRQKNTYSSKLIFNDSVTRRSCLGEAGDDGDAAMILLTPKSDAQRVQASLASLVELLRRSSRERFYSSI